jgi:uncharacterized membrane protein
MIRFWLRELAGWILIVLGLCVFYICLAMLIQPGPSIFEASILSVIGIFVFRGGIHLLKVAVAARVSMAAQEESRRQAEKRARVTDAPYDW